MQRPLALEQCIGSPNEKEFFEHKEERADNGMEPLESPVTRLTSLVRVDRRQALVNFPVKQLGLILIPED